jgi:hypothetical protein
MEPKEPRVLTKMKAAIAADDVLGGACRRQDAEEFLRLLIQDIRHRDLSADRARWWIEQYADQADHDDGYDPPKTVHELMKVRKAWEAQDPDKFLRMLIPHVRNKNLSAEVTSDWIMQYADQADRAAESDIPTSDYSDWS